jgi:hypothetical protein
MPITNKKDWNECVENNKDGYGGACIKVAEKAMEILDKEEGDFETHALICRADDESGAGGITGFMAGCVAQMISHCHSRGEEFRKKWNNDNGIIETEEGKKDIGAKKANESGGVINPAILTIG